MTKPLVFLAFAGAIVFAIFMAFHGVHAGMILIGCEPFDLRLIDPDEAYLCRAEHSHVR